MKALIQRVKSASVHVDNELVGKIEQGILIFLGVQKQDDTSIADKLVEKILAYRIFSDAMGKMNHSVKDIGGGVLIVSQFTLAADTQKGLRPGFSSAAPAEQAKLLYEYVVNKTQNLASEYNLTVANGMFGANMQVSLINDGPVTFLLDVVV